MEKWIPIIWIVGGGIGILAVTLFIDKLKSKIKKLLGRDVSSMDA